MDSFIHYFSREGHVFADLHIASGGNRTEWTASRGTRLKIPNVHGGRSATHPQQNRRLAILLEFGSMCSQAVP